MKRSAACLARDAKVRRARHAKARRAVCPPDVDVGDILVGASGAMFEVTSVYIDNFRDGQVMLRQLAVDGRRPMPGVYPSPAFRCPADEHGVRLDGQKLRPLATEVA